MFFDNALSKYLIFKEFLACNAIFFWWGVVRWGGGGWGRGYLPRLKRGLGLVFGAHKQNLLLSSYLDNC